MTALALGRPARVLSHSTDGTKYRSDVAGRNLNAWCKIPGTPFAPGLTLMPNAPDRDPVSVIFGPLDVPPEIDTFTFLLECRAAAENGNTVDVEIVLLDESAEARCEAMTVLSSRDRKSVTLTIPPGEGAPMQLRFGVSFHDFVERRIYPSVDVRYALAYERSELAELFNATGSDKGTEVSAGRGVPHCYALEYERLFGPIRDDVFDFLEIGLDNSSPPADAPSLRAWRDFFSNARIFGYDIEDFGFFQERETFTFQGDQSSRDDLTRFLRAYEMPQFRVVIDDGSHASSHQQISLATLFPHVEPGGLYIIEDLGWQPYPEEPTTLDVLEAFNDRATFDSPFVSDAEARYLETMVAEVKIRKPNDSELAVIRRKEQAR